MFAPRKILLVLVPCLLAGCGSKVTRADLPSEEKHILKLASLYSDFRAKNGRAPSNIKELKDFAGRMSKEDREARGLEDLEQAFTSPRDNQPYKVVPPQAVRPAGKGGPPGPPMPMVIIYETTGVDGKRMVASGMGGGAFELTDERLREYVPNP
jgi:hypothetical protein